MKKVLISFTVLSISLAVFGQTNLPNLSKMKTIRAKSDTVSIRDGNKFYQNAWRISPEAKPDVYETTNKKVTFITDLDSITFKTELNKIYDFVILKGKDTAWTQIKCVPSKLKILQEAGKYQTEKTDNFPKFTYQSMDNGNLKNVRTTLKLDSIAGNGDEISKILNLLYWVHNTIRHDGSNNGNCEFDAIDWYNYYKATRKGINCRSLASFLNECYLSMDIPSRFMVCLPKDSTDTDCHVINSVYSKTLKKWIWIDPTFNAYVKDENGNLLGIEEVRERLIDSKPLVLNEDANWNNEQKETPDVYWEYMSKNLYWLQCATDSKFNTESPYRDTNATYVSLVPTGFAAWGKSYSYFPKSLETTDSNYFWQKP